MMKIVQNLGRRFGTIATTLAVSLGAAQIAAAQTRFTQPDIDLEIGPAAGVKPAYEGSPRFSATGFPLIKLHRIRTPFGVFGGKSDHGFSVSPSFSFIGARKQNDDRRLRGLGNIGAAIEVGGKLSYTWRNIVIFGALRKGFGGHRGLHGELGADYVARMDQRLKLEMGPRAEFASASFMKRYFGVAPAQSLASGYRVHNPGGGFKGVGATVKATYRFNEKWALVGQTRFIRLVGSAGNAPLVRAGTPNKFSASLGLTYRFTTYYSGRR